MPRAERPTHRPRERRPIPREVIDAARKNFLHYGVNRTTMADIAGVLGIPRQTMYDYVSSRDELVDAVLVQRITEIAEELKAVEDGCSFVDAFTRTSAAAICRARDDEELMNIVATGPVDRVQAIVTGPHPEIHGIVARLLQPILDRGAETGQLRTDKSRDAIIDWVRIVYLSLINQGSIGPEKVQELVEGFLAPSVMSSDRNRR